MIPSVRVDDPPYSSQTLRVESPVPDDAKPPLFAVGCLVAGTYEIRRLLGEGGMGQVFEAHDRELNRRVAIKASWPSVDAAMLRKEAQALAAVQHAGVIQVYAYGVHEGIAYFVMERILGVDLDVHVQKRRDSAQPLSLAESLAILIQLADVLAAVHRSGIAHRDIKPSNVMLTAGSRLVLTDFGIFLTESRAEGHVPAGTVDYMAPEAFSGTITPGSAFLLDVYAFGILAYELISGFVPFNGDTLQDLMNAHVHTVPPPLSTPRPDAPPELVSLVADLLAKAPEERPESMDYVAKRLREIRSRLSEEPSANFSVLLVEDDPVIAKLVTPKIRRAVPGCEIRIATDGDTAITALAERVPDLLFLDLQLPTTNGIEVAMHLRGLPDASRCEVVVMSGGATPSDLAVLEMIGVARFVPKGAGVAERAANVAVQVYREKLGVMRESLRSRTVERISRTSTKP
jgi:serine/threonine-protein kinase